MVNALISRESITVVSQGNIDDEDKQQCANSEVVRRKDAAVKVISSYDHFVPVLQEKIAPTNFQKSVRDFG